MVKIISWNVNGIRAIRKKGFLDWLKETDADVVCVQETKAIPEQLDGELIEPDGYSAFWQSAERKGYSGVAAFCKKEPESIRILGVDEFDSEGRVQALEYGDLTIINAYFPNSRPERKRLSYKLAFVEDMLEFANGLVAEGRDIVLCGDFNIAHKPIDLARPKENENNPGYYIEEREIMTRFLDAGYVDAFRHFNKEPGHYTWWSYRAGARPRNIGWRIDCFCVNGSFVGKLRNAFHLTEVMGSDHCPIGIELTGGL